MHVRVKRSWWRPVTGSLAVLTTSAILCAMPPAAAVPDPVDESGATAGATTAVAVAAPKAVAAPVAVTPAATPDRYDRQWPKSPPWDACPRPMWPGERSTGAPGAGRRVLVIGDSLTRESRTLTAKRMRASGWTPTFRCWGSRRLDWGIDQVTRSRALRQLPDHVIIALGTNDISWETPTTTEARVRSLLNRLGSKRTVMWVDLHLTRSAWLNARADWFNGLLRRIEKQRSNLTVVGWHKVARAARIHGWDGIHYGPGGYRLRARTLVDALNREGRRNPAASPAPTPTPVPRPVTPLPVGPVSSGAPAASLPALPSGIPSSGD